MSVFLNSTPQEDGNCLNGGAFSHGNIPGVYFVSDSNVVAFREQAQGSEQWLDLEAGGEFVGVWDRNGTYLETGDTGFSFRWKIWARGAGTIDLTQDTDPSWDTSTLPAASIGSLVIAAGGWTEYNVPAGAIDLTGFLAYDGIRLGLSLASGSVDVTTIQLECVPDSGTTGWWVTQPTQDQEDLTATARSAGGLTLPEEYAATRQDAWDLAYAVALATSPALDTDPTSFGIEYYGDLVSAVAPAWARSNPVIVPEDSYMGQFNFGIRKTWVNVGGGFPTLNGDEGTDWIRIPEFTIYDGDVAYSRSAANFSALPTSNVAWDDPHVNWSRVNTAEGGDFHLANLAVWFSLDEEDPHPDTAPIDWFARGDLLKTITPTSTTHEMEEIALPSSGVFAIYAFASALDGEDPILPSDADLIVYWDAQMNIQSGSTYDPPDYQPLTYTKHFDAFAQWDPNATPPGGKLKVRLPDNTWRIVGDEAGSDTERLKLQTPDLTWWKEYRASDGAVPVHPLKLYTAGGWVFVGNMTPE